MGSTGTALVGRAQEQAELAAFVESATGGALVLRGEAGVGRSALLDHAAARAERAGHLVVRAAGVEAESALPHAGLHQLLHPLLAGLARLDDGSRAVLGSVLGSVPGSVPGGSPDVPPGDPPSVMTLGIAVLGLLPVSAARRPLLLVLDDGQWLDDSSADVLGFVGRRLAGSRVKLLVAVRTDVPSRFDTAALPELPVAALGDEDAGRLLDQRYPELDPRIRRTVLDQARGNPLALLELPAQLADRSDGLPVDGLPVDGLPVQGLVGRPGVPLPRRLHRLFGARIEALDPRVRAELLTGALDDAGSPGGAEALPDSRYRMRDADPAVAAGLLGTEPVTGELVFRHPLVRSTVVQLATADQRRAAHLVLARAHRGNLERRAAHLAAATVDPDEDVAAVLEAAAESAARRGGAPAAVHWLTRAAELSEDRAERHRRLAEAAFVAGHAARLGQAQRPVRAELRAADVPSHRPAPEPARSPAPASAPASAPVSAPLTSQERRIAELAAGGLTNKEIGHRMHLSPRTVGSHLYRIFPKLGITARAALRDALNRADADRRT
ncbi:AAA family ATPase [Kitasatospora sp. NPDC059160]|uniref:helix-turn-helix transcriptional regulator n=1 Tax=Kitasatospora sp. NPDC059160 TaxID=3346748 RepID=UPI00367958D2